MRLYSDIGEFYVDWQAWLSLALTVGSLCILMLTRLAPHVVLLGAMAILSATGVLSPEEALGGFANPGLITVAAMFAVAAGLHATGGDRSAGQPLSR